MKIEMKRIYKGARTRGQEKQGDKKYKETRKTRGQERQGWGQGGKKYKGTGIQGWGQGDKKPGTFENIVTSVLAPWLTLKYTFIYPDRTCSY
jgi:hypothetical protein